MSNPDIAGRRAVLRMHSQGKPIAPDADLDGLAKRTVGMRSEPEHEIAGLDLPEMGALAYPDFLEAQGPVFAPLDVALTAHTGPHTGASLREEMVR